MNVVVAVRPHLGRRRCRRQKKPQHLGGAIASGEATDCAYALEQAGDALTTSMPEWHEFVGSRSPRFAMQRAHQQGLVRRLLQVEADRVGLDQISPDQQVRESAHPLARGCTPMIGFAADPDCGRGFPSDAFWLLRSGQNLELSVENLGFEAEACSVADWHPIATCRHSQSMTHSLAPSSLLDATLPPGINGRVLCRWRLLAGAGTSKTRTLR